MLMKSPEQIISMAKKTIQLEAEALGELNSRIDEGFVQAVMAVYNTKGRLVITGIGKSANIAQKLVATMNSTGTVAVFMHAADALHGDLGMVMKDDVVLCISNSGNSPEIKVLIPFIKQRGNQLIAITGNLSSYLAESADFVLNTTVTREACPNNLAPTTSTTAQLAMGDALAVALLDLKGFTAEDFAMAHPGGSLGKKLLLKVDDFCADRALPLVRPNTSLVEVIHEISEKRLGAAIVLESDKLIGIITDGDIRRWLSHTQDISKTIATDVMTKNPKVVHLGTLAKEVLDLMQGKNITQIVVVNSDNEPVGLVHIHDLIREGLAD
jgi:arabinose-5-phosphate isomerase